MNEPIYINQHYESIKEIRDEAIGLQGYLVIGSRINGLTCGGLRIHNKVNVQELKDLAKVMELKQTFIGLPRGGSRAGIIADYHLPQYEKQRLMNRFAELVKSELQSRRWLVAIDVGTNIDLAQNMYKHIGVDIPKPSEDIANAGYFTALGVEKSIEVSLSVKNLDIENCKFAIEGMGNVGHHLYKILTNRGACVVAASNISHALYNENGLIAEEALSLSESGEPLIKSFGTKLISKEELLYLPVDVLAPCATDSTIHSANVTKVKANIICAGANNPVTYAASQVLFERGACYLPDFMTNAGGALGNMVKFAGLPERYFLDLLEKQFTNDLRQVYDTSQAQNKTPSTIAIKALDAKFERMKLALEVTGNKNTFREFALAVYRKGYLPKFLIRPVAIRKINKSFGIY